MDIIFEKWDEILESIRLEHELTDVSFRTWLQPLKVHSFHENIVTILVPSGQMGIEYINKKFILPLQVSIEELTDLECEIELIKPEDAEEYMLPKIVTALSNDSIEKANLNPKYTFDTFIVGGNNRFAHSAALAVAESPGENYNPLFLYGGVGLGKTHLMHSVAHFILEKNPNAKVLYVTSEYFTNELIGAIRNGNNTAMSKFREKYRSIDVLLIDDVQFIIGKESTQEEFFHTFNDLHGAKKQIIISSDKPPKEFETLEARLRSRFEWGLIADIQSPDYETRMAILQKKQETERCIIENDVIEYIATNIKSNIRELEGALNKLIALSKLNNSEITLELAEKELQDIISPDTPKQITPELIINTVAEHFKLAPDVIISKKRTSDLVFPRHIIMYLCREMTSEPLKSIGKSLGGKDHTTVMNGINRIKKEVATNETTKNQIEIIKKKISPA